MKDMVVSLSAFTVWKQPLSVPMFGEPTPSAGHSGKMMPDSLDPPSPPPLQPPHPGGFQERARGFREKLHNRGLQGQRGLCQLWVACVKLARGKYQMNRMTQGEMWNPLALTRYRELCSSGGLGTGWQQSHWLQHWPSNFTLTLRPPHFFTGHRHKHFQISQRWSKSQPRDLKNLYRVTPLPLGLY